jgi:signal transduction histidine kinase/ActR/RegA family two-component response regulator
VGIAFVKRRDAGRALVAAALVAMSLLAVFAIELSDTQAGSKKDVTARVHERAVLAAALIDSLFQSVGQQAPQNAKTYGARIVRTRTLDENLQRNEYLALLDSTGAVIAHSRGFTPEARADLSQSAALRLVRAGHPYGLGNVLPYGKTGVIDLAVSFPTPFGVRTLVTGFPPSVLATFFAGELTKIPGVKGAHNYLIDGNNTVIGSTNPARPVGYVFRKAAQVQALAHSSGDRNGSYYDQVPLSSSTWRIVLAAPDGRLFASVEGLRKWVPWAIFVAFALVALTAILLGRRVLRSAEQMHDANVQLESANRAKSVFLSRMSHELRTPLNAILGFGQLLEMEDLQGRDRESVEQIVRAGRHLLELIDEVLDISRIEAGTLNISLEPVDVVSGLSEVLSLVAPLAAERGIELLADLDPSESRYVAGDRQRLRQVLLNLLSNAIKYNREGGRVRVSVSNSGERLRIVVADDGEGIAEDKLDQVFAPFERLGAENTGVEGTGLGLALSKSLVEAMNGSIGVSSEPGAGSTFFVELDVAASPVSRETLDAARAAGAADPARTSACTLLYIEDNLSNLKLIQHIFADRPEVRLLSAMQGELGLQLARAQRPDVILLDLHLPDMSGEQVLASLREYPETERIPVIVLSADATSKRVDGLREAGARGYLTKPLDVTHFLDTVNEALNPRETVRS